MIQKSFDLKLSAECANFFLNFFPDCGSGGLAGGPRGHGPQQTFRRGAQVQEGRQNFMKFDGSITFFSSTTW